MSLLDTVPDKFSDFAQDKSVPKLHTDQPDHIIVTVCELMLPCRKNDNDIVIMGE